MDPMYSNVWWMAKFVNNKLEYLPENIFKLSVKHAAWLLLKGCSDL